jgi:EAL domain-containing protein (putative c-di-GMP-specific phosphodiesterase class I)
MSNAARSQQVLERLHGTGIRVAIDDFGTGYSSLAYLKNLTVDKLKIDQGFVRCLPEDQADQSIVTAVIALAKGLGFQVIAEGVENATQAALLQEMGCGEVQGYLYAKPMPPDALDQWLEARG